MTSGDVIGIISGMGLGAGWTSGQIWDCVSGQGLFAYSGAGGLTSGQVFDIVSGCGLYPFSGTTQVSGVYMTSATTVSVVSGMGIGNPLDPYYWAGYGYNHVSGFDMRKYPTRIEMKGYAQGATNQFFEGTLGPIAGTTKHSGIFVVGSGFGVTTQRWMLCPTNWQPDSYLNSGMAIRSLGYIGTDFVVSGTTLMHGWWNGITFPGNAMTSGAMISGNVGNTPNGVYAVTCGRSGNWHFVNAYASGFATVVSSPVLVGPMDKIAIIWRSGAPEFFINDINYGTVVGNSGFSYISGAGSFGYYGLCQGMAWGGTNSGAQTRPPVIQCAITPN